MRMNKRNLILLLILFAPILANNLLVPSVKAAFYQSTYEDALPRQTWQQGVRLVAHDANALTQVNYYAVLYVDSAYSLYLNAYWYLGNSIVLTQKVVNASQWIGAASNSSCYAVSNVINSRFWVFYQTSLNTFAIRQVQFNYTSAYVFTNFVVSDAIPFEAPEIIFDQCFEVMQTSSAIWLGFITQTEVLKANAWQIVNNVKSTSISISLPDWSNWSLQLGRIGTQIYVWTYAQLDISTNVGSLYFANNGTYILASSGSPAASSVVSLTNNSIAIIYSNIYNEGANCIMYSSLTNYKETDIPLTYARSVSAFAMPNGYMGFFYTDIYGLNVAYHSQNASSPSRWSWTATLLANLNPQLPFMQDQVYADPDTTLITYPSHPTAWIMATFNNIPYWSLISVDFSNVNNISYTTAFSSFSSTQYWTYISIRTTYSSYTTKTTVNTISASLLQSSAFLQSSVILVSFILIPAGIFGAIMGIIGFSFGAMIGTAVAYSFGQLPLWLLLVIVLIMAMLLFVARSASDES